MKNVMIAALLLLIFPRVAVSADLRFAITADAGKRNGNSDMVRSSIKRAGIYDLILPGDNLYESTYSAVWSGWISDGFRFPVAAIGNHNGGYSEEMRFFQMPAEYYSKTAGDSTRFIVLNSDNQATANQQATFLNNELENAQERFIFIVYHHPTYTLSHTHNWQEKQAFQLAIRPLLANYRNKITAILVGHDHLAMLAHFGDIPVIVSGAIWETRSDSPINNTQDGVAITTQWFYDRQPYWAKLEVDEQSNAAIVRYIRASGDLVRCSASIVTGQSATLLADCHESFGFLSIIKRFFRV